MNTGELKERNLKKSKRNRMTCFNIYIVVFGILFICCLTASKALFKPILDEQNNFAHWPEQNF